MKKQLDNTRNLKRKRRAPCTALKILLSHRNSRWEQVFQEPLISGMSAKLEDLLKRKHFPPLIGQSSREVNFEHGEAEPPIRTPVDELEIEQPRCEVGYSNDIAAEILASRSFTPSTAATLESAVHTENDSRMGFDPEREVPASAEPNLSVIDESAMDDARQFTPEETPEFRLRHSSEDLDCLEADASQTGTTQDRAERWSVRTRAVAQYLKKSFKGPLDSPGRLNLSNILEGRRRKECARMFYEVLVLKSRGCIELYQEKPYDDITISQAPGLTNTYL
ncbi:Sister chromatid cohesion 1 protein 3 [Nymphaea thermarum]|nr:Sister chromatid cohesion 1 protein 3 [Nymphaea thermarum]